MTIINPGAVTIPTSSRRPKFDIPVSAVTDPLAGLTLGMRLQTHLPGSGEVQLGLYKDVLCTDPVIEEGDVVAGVKDEIGALGIMAVQATLAKRPMALLDDDGNWVMDFDGIDDWLLWDVGNKGGQITYSALFKSNTATFNNYWGLLDSAVAFGDAGDRWACFASGTTVMYNDPSYPPAVAREGVPLVSPFDLTPINTGPLVVTITTRTSDDAVARGIGQLEQLYYGAFQLSALVVHEPADSATVVAYLQTLK